MAEQPKEIRNRIRSVGSTKKITRTMELVATSKMKRAQDRVNAAVPYLAKLEEVFADVVASGVAGDDVLLRSVETPRRIALLIITANRGLCGGYNANVVRLAKRTIADFKGNGCEVSLDVIGKKGTGTLGYQGYAIARKHLDIGDRPSYADAQRVVAPLVEDFRAGRCDEVLIISTRWKSVASQTAKLTRLLPVTRDAAGDSSRKRTSKDMIFSPDPASILARLLPMYVTQTVYTCMVEALAGEQVARRTAMKNATDNAQEMMTHLTRNLNRARQAQITQEIAELVGGAEALKG